MSDPRRRRRQHPRRPAFTLIELLIAAMVSALAAAAGTALIYGVSYASTQTRTVRETKSAGNYLLSRLATSIRDARCIGQVTPTSFTVWSQDLNNDDAISLYELGFVYYDSGTKQVIYRYVQVPGGVVPAVPVTLAAFKNPAAVNAQITGPNAKTVVWAEGIETFSLTGSPSYTDTRIVDVKFTIGTGNDEIAFTTAASPRAPADYLFVNEAKVLPDTASDRTTRKEISRWEGYDDIRGVTAP